MRGLENQELQLLERMLEQKTPEERLGFLGQVFGDRIKGLIESGRDIVFVYDLGAAESVGLYEAIQFAQNHYPFHVRTLSKRALIQTYAARDGCLVEAVAILTLAYLRQLGRDFKVVICLGDPVAFAIRQYLATCRTRERRIYGAASDYTLDFEACGRGLNPHWLSQWIEQEQAVLPVLGELLREPIGLNSSINLEQHGANVLVCPQASGVVRLEKLLGTFLQDQTVRVLDTGRFSYAPHRELLAEASARVHLTAAQLEAFYSDPAVTAVFDQTQIAAWRAQWSTASTAADALSR